MSWTKEQLAATKAGRRHLELHALAPAVTAASLLAAVDCVPMPCQQEAGLNQTERAYLAHLRAQGCYRLILIQALALRIGSERSFYHPDFTVLAPSGRLEMHETKGFLRDDARRAIYAAAKLYPVFDFRLIRRAKGGGWDIKEIPA